MRCGAPTSGTNVTKTEYFYRDHIVYRYHLRVHPIPLDGLYTSWDYNHDAVATYFNEVKTQGVPVDGRNDDIGQVDSIEGIGQAYFDAPDPTHSRPLVLLSWEQVAGTAGNGSDRRTAVSMGRADGRPYQRRR